jgi:hypothetical protein
LRNTLWISTAGKKHTEIERWRDKRSPLLFSLLTNVKIVCSSAYAIDREREIEIYRERGEKKGRKKERVVNAYGESDVRRISNPNPNPSLTLKETLNLKSQQ